MRELKRSIAKANMRAQGVARLFKRRSWGQDSKRQSIFARNWRDFVDLSRKGAKKRAARAKKRAA